MQKVITIIGNIGSGKSTALPIIAEHFNAHTIAADEFFQTTDPFAKPYLKDMERWAFTNELWLTVERSKMIRQELQDASEAVAVVDSGLLMSWVYTHSHYTAGRLTEAEWEFYQQLYDHFSQSILRDSCVVFLNYKLETLLSRIQKRGREFELEYYTEEYLEQLQAGLETMLAMLHQRGVAVVEISEAEAQDFEQSQQDAQTMVQTISHSFAL